MASRVAPEILEDDLEPKQGDEVSFQRNTVFARTWQIAVKMFGAQHVFVMVLKVCIFLALVTWTAFLTRMNMEHIKQPSVSATNFYGDSGGIGSQLLHGVVRPVMCFLSFLPFFFFRLKSKLKQGSLGGCIVVAFCSAGVELLVAGSVLSTVTELDGTLRFLRLTSRFGLVMVAFFQLKELGRVIVARCALGSFGVAMIGAAVFFQSAMLGPVSSLELWSSDTLVGLSDAIFWTGWVFYTAVPTATLLYEAHVKQRLFEKKKSKDAEFKLNVDKTLRLLRLGAVLTFLDGSYFAVTTLHDTGLSRSLAFTVDNMIVLSSIFVKGGFLNNKKNLDHLQVLHELDFLALTHGKRIAFPGRVNLDSQHCIVSFPGKYADEWDSVVRMAQLRPGACSLACVFLTDEASGLGQHQENPEQPGDCWCKAIYGRLPGNVYLSVVEDAGAMSQEDLGFKEADARAMGQIFLKRGEQSDAQWQKEKEEAKIKAEQKCEENHGLAPWGCFWFHQWLKRVEEAKEHSQTFHVFYFENRVGCGKLPWQELSNEVSVKEARENSGLGTSQTAEVAYLEHRGYHFEEHNVKDFYNFMNAHNIND